MAAIDMLLKSMGIDPQVLTAQANGVLAEAKRTVAHFDGRMNKMEIMLQKILDHYNIDYHPDNNQEINQTKEVVHVNGSAKN